MEQETQEACSFSLLNELTRPLSIHFGYTLSSFMAIYIYTCTVMFM